MSAVGINKENPELRDGGVGGRGLCAAPHPDRNDVWCRRAKGHEDRDDDGHAAFVVRVSEPEYWKDTDD